MSHFSVLVITDKQPTHDVLTKVLQPWHEYECTGTDDEYVVDVDKTSEARENYSSSTRRMLRGPKGGLSSPYEDRFYREPTPDEEKVIGKIAGSGGNGEISWTSKDWKDGCGYRTKVRFVPDDFSEVEVPLSEVESFADWASDYYGLQKTKNPDKRRGKGGHIHVDQQGQVIAIVDRTNPNAKWDWWTVGGRYSGRLAAGYDPTKDERNFETCFLCHGTGKRDDEIGRQHRFIERSYTCNGCNGKGQSLKFESKWIDVGNQARLETLDLSAMKATRVAERMEIVENIRQKFGGTLEELEAARLAYTVANKVWLALPEPRPRGSNFNVWLSGQPSGAAAVAYNTADTWNSISTADGQSISDWIEAAPALSAWAVVKDGEWTEKGSMGWFGMSSNDKDDDQWQRAVGAVVESLPLTAWLSFVDCHI